MQPTRVLATFALPDQEAERIRAQFPTVSLQVERLEAAQMEQVAETDALWAGRFNAGLLRGARRLRWVHTFAAGVENYLFPEFVASPVLFTNSRGIAAAAVADHALALMLALARRLPESMRHQTEQRWVRPVPESLTGKTVAIIGLGALGEAVARRALAFDLRVLGVRRTGPIRGGSFPVYATDRLAEVLKQADYVVLTAPATPETRHLINATALSWMRPTAYLVNVARGQLVDEAALVEALAAGRVAGAGLDVFEEEPLPPSSRLWDLPRVIITPHDAGSSEDFMTRATSLYCDLLERFLAGQPLYNLVDKARGY